MNQTISWGDHMSQMIYKGLTCEPDSRLFCCKWRSCNKAFKRRSDMKRHYKIHTNDRPHPCKAPGCDKRFIQRSALVVHTRTHTGEKPHECLYPGCFKRFSDSSSLSRHRHVHARNRPRKCGHIECPKSICRRNFWAKPEQQPQRRDFLYAPTGKYASDSEASQSPSISSQPATPQPSQNDTACQVSILQESIIEDMPYMAKLDSSIHSYYMNQLLHPLHSIGVDELFSGIPTQSLLYNLGQGNAGLDIINRSSQYHDLTEQIHRPAMGMSSPSPGLGNAPNGSTIALSSTSRHNCIIPGGNYKQYSEYGDSYSLFNTSSMERHVQGTIYSQQSPQAQQQLLILPDQILNHAAEGYGHPLTLITSEPWDGFISHFP